MQCLYWSYSRRIKWWTAGSLVTMLTQASDVGKASSSCASWVFPCILLFLCSQQWPGWQLFPSLLAWKATGSSEDRNLQLCVLFLFCPAGKDVPSFGRSRCQPICYKPSDFYSSFEGHVHVTFCSASFPFLLHLALLWSMSQHPRGWNSQCAGTTKDGFPKAEPQRSFDSSSFKL